MTRIHAAAVTAAALLFSACGTDAKPASEPDPASSQSSPSSAVATPSETSPVETEAVDFENECLRKSPPVPANVAAEFGTKQVTAALCEFVGMQTTIDFNERMMRKTEGFTTSDFAPVVPYLHPQLRLKWDRVVQKTIASPSAVGGDSLIFTFMYFNLPTPTKSFEFRPTADDEAAFTNLRWRQDKAEVVRGGDGGVGLKLTIRFDVDIRVAKGDEPYVIPVTKIVEYSVVPNNRDESSQDQPWLIYDTRINSTLGKPRPDA